MSWRGAPCMRVGVRLVQIALAACVLVACGASSSIRVLNLQVTRTGEYLLQGKTVPKTELRYELRAAASDPGSVDLRITADGMATFEAVGVAVQAAQYAGIGRVAF